MPTGNPINIIERLERHSLEMRDDECWITDYKPMSDGYVRTSIRIDNVPTNPLIHRIAWEAHNAEPIPEGMVVMHTCDNRACFNPQHLRLGTQSDNIRDCVSKGRHSSYNRRGTGK